MSKGGWAATNYGPAGLARVRAEFRQHRIENQWSASRTKVIPLHEIRPVLAVKNVAAKIGDRLSDVWDLFAVGKTSGFIPW